MSLFDVSADTGGAHINKKQSSAADLIFMFSHPTFNRPWRDLSTSFQTTQPIRPVIPSNSTLSTLQERKYNHLPTLHSYTGPPI